MDFDTKRPPSKPPTLSNICVADGALERAIREAAVQIGNVIPFDNQHLLSLASAALKKLGGDSEPASRMTGGGK